MEELRKRGLQLVVSLTSSTGIQIAGFPAYGSDPSKLKFKSSTDYFIFMNSNRNTRFDYSYFSAPGMQKVQGLDATAAAKFKQLGRRANAWSVMGGVKDEDSEATPLLFSKNFALPSGSAPPLPGTKLEPYLSPTNTPFGTDGVCVVFFSGSAKILKPADLSAQFSRAFNPSNLQHFAIMAPE